MSDRYSVEQAEDGTWMVVDTFTGWPVTVYGATMIDMDAEDADDMTEALNILDEYRREEEG